MKSKNKSVKSWILSTVLGTLMVSGGSVTAQADPDEYKNDELAAVFSRLDELMSEMEDGVRYVAPMEDDIEINIAWERLEMLANKIENDILYKVPFLDEYSGSVYAGESSMNSGDKLYASNKKKSSKNRR